MIRISIFLFLTVILLQGNVNAQELVVPLDHNLQYKTGLIASPYLHKPTANTLPFFEDFSGNSIFPDNSKWMDQSVYINNTMGVNVISRGVATFDALNAQSLPYDPSNSLALLYADSLTSLPFDFSSFIPSDSVYLSFFYQPQGNGFAPETQDSLILFLKNKNNDWISVWSVAGSPLQSFRQAMIPITDTGFLHSSFQLRFVNKASININDDVWNLDYIRINAHRTFTDTAILDIATALPATNLLNDYTSLPFRHFKANMSNELATQHTFYVNNSSATPQLTTSGCEVKELSTGTQISNQSVASIPLPPYTVQPITFPIFPINYNPSSNYSKVVFENKYFTTTAATDFKPNDTIIHHQVFDNYLAYDDGTAEKSYFLKQFSTLPAKLAIEYHLNTADSLRGFSVYFGRQVPLASSKFFTVVVYKDIAINNGTDVKLYEQQLFFPNYSDTIDKFWQYKFDEPIALSSGTFYLSIVQPAYSGSDSLYYGLDVNRIGSNHAYYNVLNKWENSTVGGAIMLRPILGQNFISSSVNETLPTHQQLIVYPNPVSKQLFIKNSTISTNLSFEISDILGNKIKSGLYHESIDVSNLLPGMYFIRIFGNQNTVTIQKFIKE